MKNVYEIKNENGIVKINENGNMLIVVKYKNDGENLIIDVVDYNKNLVDENILDGLVDYIVCDVIS